MRQSSTKVERKDKDGFVVGCRGECGSGAVISNLRL